MPTFEAAHSWGANICGSGQVAQQFPYSGTVDLSGTLTLTRPDTTLTSLNYTVFVSHGQLGGDTVTSGSIPPGGDLQTDIPFSYQGPMKAGDMLGFSYQIQTGGGIPSCAFSFTGHYSQLHDVL